jgi:arylsulfatase A
MCLTHGPHELTPDNKDAPDADKMSTPQRYKGVVEYMDKLVGRLVAALDELGLRDNTVVFYTGDNGTGGQGKGEPTELGARVPMIVNCPGIVKTRGATGELTDLSDIAPTLVDLAGAELPTDRPIDGRSYAKFLKGETDATRDWIFAFIGDRRMLRTKRWLLEDNSPLHWGRLYDCGSSRDGSGYTDVTNSEDPEALAVKEQFKALLEKLPAPVLPEEGSAAEQKESRQERKEQRKAGEKPARKRNSE